MADHVIWGKAEPFNDDSSSYTSGRSSWSEHGVEYHDESDMTERSFSVNGSQGSSKLSSKRGDVDGRSSGSAGPIESLTYFSSRESHMQRQQIATIASGMLNNSRSQEMEKVHDLQYAMNSGTSSRGEDYHALTSGLDQIPESFEAEALHRSGQCKPCRYLTTRLGCLNSSECPFCHLPHNTNQKEKQRSRPCKAKRNQCKQIKNMLHAVLGEESPEFQAASERLANENVYMRSILGLQNQPVNEPRTSRTLAGYQSVDDPLSAGQASSGDMRQAIDSGKDFQ